MDVLVFNPNRDKCPAELALLSEGIPHQTIKCLKDSDYATAIYERWSEPKGFISLEHDVVPWVGAIENIQNCKNDWCVYEYPFAPNKVRWSMGCMKLSANALGYLSLENNFKYTPWNYLDGKLITELVRAGVTQPCVHYPALAHLRKQ